MIEHIGIVGGGQLGRMLTDAALPLGLRVTVLDPAPGCPAAQSGAEQIVGGLRDADAIARLADVADVVTWEIEHIDADVLERLAAGGVDVQPSPTTLKVIQDKLAQKRMLAAAGLPVAEFAPLDADAGPQQVEQVVASLGGDVIFKARRGGYDGRGNHVWTGDLGALGEGWGDLYVERVVPFDRELSVIAARDVHGDTLVYPTVETVHRDNICHTVLYPPRVGAAVAEEAQTVARRTLGELEGAGVFAIEMFATAGGVLVNEIAPRVHNSGHHTIEANVTSQFEQHIRAVAGLPLGSTAPRSGAAAMVNILGTRDEPLNRTGLEKVLALPDVHPHYYGKSPRPARKIGHITVLGDDAADVLARAERSRAELAV